MMTTLLKSKRFEIVRKSFVRKGKTLEADAVVHPGSVVILPMLSDDRCLLLRNNRWAVDERLWELPAGTLDVAGESLESAAMRELEEEAGYKAARIEHLSSFYPSPGFLTEVLHGYVATGLTRTRQDLEDAEDIEVAEVSFKQALEMILDGRIRDAKTMVLLMLYDLRRRTNR
jgi:ADP-ribose pyrophosphatase